MILNAEGLHYRDLNERVHALLEEGERNITVENVCGHRYLGVGLGEGVSLTLNGVPGNDLGAFMNGARVFVSRNVQDGTGNTMNAGKIVIRGDAGDVLAHSMRGGRIFVRGKVGYRAGIHMKAYGDHVPVVVIGGTAGDYLGEYMAGGMLVVLNRGATGDASPVGKCVGTGMHGGVIFVRGTVEPYQLGREVKVADVTEEDWGRLSKVLDEYARDFKCDATECRREEFIKLEPHSARPYGRMYAY